MPRLPGGKGETRVKQPNRKKPVDRVPVRLSETAAEVFLEQLRLTANVQASLRAADLSRCVAYKMRDSDPEFNRRWEEALDRGFELLEEEALRRAHDGVEEPVYQGGKRVGTIRKYSDVLTMFLLNGRRPDRYRQRTSTDVTSKSQVIVKVTPDDSKL